MTRSLAMLLLLPACTIHVSTHEDSLEFDTLDAPVSAVVVDVDAGGLELVGADTDTITIERKLQWSGECPEASAEVVDGALVITARCPDGSLFCAASHRVVMPRALAIDAWVGAGGVTAESLDGDLDLVIESGGAELSSLSGALDIDLGSGGVDATALSSTVVSAHVGSGGLDMSFDVAPEQVTVAVGSGGVSLSVPAGAYAVDTRVGSGGVEVSGLTVDPDAPNRLTVEVGSGGVEVSGR